MNRLCALLLMLSAIIGCSSAQIIIPPPSFPTAYEQSLAQHLNYCKRGKYYRLLEYKHQMMYYVEVADDIEVKSEAEENLIKTDQAIQKLLHK